ncbi:UNVERIFIED_CONTAM: Patatin-like protein 2 [Sesamum angustifolium]|uniref:Patatin-like protein 2 n=1 Tax=Sesamum angustifolium TaxID=2727405 RepID=A0AAW2RM07_9LAMI
MITAPDEEKRPMYAAKDIVDFYLQHCPGLFPGCSRHNLLKTFKNLFGPKYNGRYLRTLLREQLGTSAAPKFLPAHYFVTNDERGKVTSYDLIDGGVAANNPTLIAISHISSGILAGDSEYVQMDPLDSSKILVLSLGTGIAKQAHEYNAETAADGACLDGCTKKATHHCLMFSAMQAPTWLICMFPPYSNPSIPRTITYVSRTICGDKCSLDIATPENLEALVEAANQLLKKPTSSVNLEMGELKKLKERGQTKKC